MQRMLMVMAMMGATGLGLGAAVRPVGAEANPRAVCVGEIVSALAGPGFGGLISDLAHTGQLGGVISIEASTDTCAD